MDFRSRMGFHSGHLTITKLLACVLSFLLLLSACGGSDSPDSSTDPSISLSATVDTATAPENPTNGVAEDTAVPAETNSPATMPSESTAPEITAPPTQPPATTSPATEPPTTTPPASDPPATEPPTTVPPTTKPPATDPPATTSPNVESTGIVFVSWPKTVSRNEDATVTIKGAPNTKYSITVYYKSGASKADGLEDKVSDANGNVSWTWHVGGKTSAGTFKIVVSGGGCTETVEFTVVV